MQQDQMERASLLSASVPKHGYNNDIELVEGGSANTVPVFSLQNKRVFRIAVIIATVILVATILTSVLITVYKCKDCASNSASSTTAYNTCTEKGVTASNGIVSTTHSLASDAGLQILEQGGNAFDAAAAVEFVLNVVQPQSTGIGGGGFCLLFNAKDQKVYALDGREEAPNAFTEDMFCSDVTCTQALPFIETATGGNPVGVPGTLASIVRMLLDHGTMPLAQVLQPAIKIARVGFPMYQEMADRLMKNRDRMLRYNATANLFFPNPGQQPVKVGDLAYNLDLANTFERLATVGAADFYNGTIAAAIVNTSRNAVNNVTGLAGVITLEDMQGYRAVYREVLNQTYRDFLVTGFNMPSSGGLSLSMMLNLLEYHQLYDIQPQSGEWLHRVLDAQDIVFADRSKYMADADFIDVPTAGLIDKAYAYERLLNFSRSLISARSAQDGNIPAGFPANMPNDYGSDPMSARHGTTHWVVIDKWGNVASITQTIEENFGSAVVVDGYGFILNNELTDFTSLPRDPVTNQTYANRPEGGKMKRRSAINVGKGTDNDDSDSLGGKRPLSAMTPTIIFNISNPTLPYAALGSPGGNSIISTVLNTIVNLLDGHMCLGDAIAAPRAISRNNVTPGDPALEDGFFVPRYAADLALLEARKFNYSHLVTDRPLGYVQGGILHGLGNFGGAADSSRLPTASAVGF